MDGLKKILVCLPSLTNGDGIANFYMNYYENIVKNGYAVDFLCVSHEKYSDKWVKKLNNSKVFIIPKHNFFTRIFVLRRYLKKNFLESSYDIIHDNLVDMNAFLINTFFGKRGSKIILHVHNPIYRKKKMINRFFLKLAVKRSDYLCACSESAGKSVLGRKKFDIIKNKIDINKFKFDKNKRNEMRNELNISDDCVLIGSVGRMCNQKNPKLVYKIINELCNDINCKSIWIGNGKLERVIKEYVKENNIEDKCIFVESTANIEKYYSAMDIFLLPSIYEGLGIVFVEAQASGLEIFTSNMVPKDICITNLVHEFGLNENINVWVNEIKNVVKGNRIRRTYDTEISMAGYSSDKNDDMTKIYNKILVGEK